MVIHKRKMVNPGFYRHLCDKEYTGKYYKTDYSCCSVRWNKVTCKRCREIGGK